MQFITRQLQGYRAKIEEIVKDLHHLTQDIGHETLSNTISELRNRIQDPFMFVIVGEVKAGKSSFINALLDTGKEVCKVAPQPMTDTIQQVVWGEKEEVIVINEHLKKITHPVEILKEIAIVDTPGTNTIVQNHQEITERFIPSSDLIVFVFDSKNPYRQSAWDFFDFIHKEWQRKIVFVLQQKDLMVPSDLEININGVREMAIKKGINDPKIFAVSAKMELEGNYEGSGFSFIRDYIKSNITGGKAPVLKLLNNIETGNNINERIHNGLADRKKQWQIDVNFRNDIKQTLDAQELRSEKEVDILIENILAAYDRTTRKTELELEDGLSFVTLIKRSFSSMFNSDNSAKNWLDTIKKDLEQNLNTELKNKMHNGVTDLADSIQQMAKMIDLKIKNSQTVLKDNHEIFSDIADRRSNVLRDLQETFSKFMERSENFADEKLFPERASITPNLATGGGLAVIGIVLAAVTQTSVFDITGGILTTVGLVFAGVTVGLKRRKILDGFKLEIAKGRKRLEEEISDNLRTYIHNIKRRIDSNFINFDNMLDFEAEQIKSLESRYQEIKVRLGNIRVELGE